MAVKKSKKPEAQTPETVFCAYLGPSIRGSITKGQIFPLTKAQAVAELASIIERYPSIADLIVDGDELPAARVRIAQTNSLLHKTYEKLVKGQK